MEQVPRRLSIINFPLRQPLLLHIQTALEDHNSYVKELKHVCEITKGSQQISNFKIVIREDARPSLQHTRLPWNILASRGTCSPPVKHARLPWNIFASRGTCSPPVEHARLPWNILASRGTCSPL